MMGVWDELEKRLDIVTQDGVVKKPKIADLDQYERESGFNLPEDYREFALAFGPGGFGTGEWAFATPGFSKGHDLVDLVKSCESWRRSRIEGCSDADLSRSFGVDAARVRRLIPFCNRRTSGDGFAWDPSDVTDTDRHEYGIYHITFDRPPIVRVASTFREFVMDYALGGGFERHLYDESADKTGELSKPDPIGFAQGSIPTDHED
jgi:hypothetical protein